MNFRSSNPEGYVHFGGDVMSGANSSRGVLLSSNVVSPVSDNNNEDLVLKGKGTGGVLFGASTTPFNLRVGESTTAVPNMPANSLIRSTMTCVGISTGDLILSVSPRDGLSTGVSLVRSYAGVDEIINEYINPHASSIAAEAALVCRWVFIDRT
jgi:hypothetical protein